MAVLEIVKVPNPILRKVTEKVKGYNQELLRLVDDMAETMYSAPGVGLAANQVGILKQVAVVDTSPPEEPKNLLVLINPEIIESEGLEEFEEGCLSVPEFKQVVGRPGKIKVRAKNLKGEQIEINAEGLLARAIQHELDHLNGRLILGLGAGAVWMGWQGFPDEVTDTKIRAEMLDEGIEILTLLYQRRPFDYDGKHYHLKLTLLDEMHYPPKPVQQPRIPIWVPGIWPRMKSMRRLLKCDGLSPRR
jgi:peptide deformylase